jgi:hypothetical protein
MNSTLPPAGGPAGTGQSASRLRREPFSVHVEDNVLSDLRARIHNTCGTCWATGRTGSTGVPASAS